MKRKRVLITPSAKQDILEIVQYIRDRSPGMAPIVLRTIHAELRKLGTAPGIGHSRADLGDPALRVLRVYSYLGVYREHAKTVEVIRVIHGARNLEAIFKRFPTL